MNRVAPAPAPENKPAWGNLQIIERKILDKMDSENSISNIPPTILASIYDLLDKADRESLAKALCTENGCEPSSRGSVSALFLLRFMQYALADITDTTTTTNKTFTLFLSKYHSGTARFLSYKTISFRYIRRLKHMDVSWCYDMDPQYYGDSTTTEANNTERYVAEIISGWLLANNQLDFYDEDSGDNMSGNWDGGNWGAAGQPPRQQARATLNPENHYETTNEFIRFANTALTDFDIENIKAYGAHMDGVNSIDIDTQNKIKRTMMKISSNFDILRSILFDVMKKNFKWSMIALTPKILFSKKIAIVIRESFLLSVNDVKYLKETPSNLGNNVKPISQDEPAPAPAPAPVQAPVHEDRGIHGLIIPYSVHVSLLNSIDDFIHSNKNHTIDRANMQERSMFHILNLMISNDNKYKSYFTTEGFKSVVLTFTISNINTSAPNVFLIDEIIKDVFILLSITKTLGGGRDSKKQKIKYQTRNQTRIKNRNIK
jgi:hypothetical protein